MFIGKGPIYHGHLIGTLTQDMNISFRIDSNRNRCIYIWGSAGLSFVELKAFASHR